MPSFNEFSLPDREIADLLPESIARELQVVALREFGEVLVVAGPEFLSRPNVERLSYILNRKVRSVKRTREWFEQALALQFPAEEEASCEFSTSSVSVSSYYWEGDKLAFPASGWRQTKSGSDHWSGALVLAPDHPDYRFWCWVIRYPIYQRRIDDKEVPSIRRVWLRWISRSQPPDAKC